MDYQSLLFDPIYTIHGVPVSLTLDSSKGGATFGDLVALDKTAGIEIGGGGAGGDNAIHVYDIQPAAVFRMPQLVAAGLTAAMLFNALLTINGYTWKIVNTKPRPSPRGESDGELLCFLAEKQAVEDSESESE